MTANGHETIEELRGANDADLGEAPAASAGAAPAEAPVDETLWWFEPVAADDAHAGGIDEQTVVADTAPAPPPVDDDVIGTTPLGFVLRRRPHSRG